MNISQWSKVLLIVLLCGAAFLSGIYWPASPKVESEPDGCSAGSIPQSFGVLNSLLREFDDAATLAINLPREFVVDQVETLQMKRRQAEQLPVPSCVLGLKSRMVEYMNQVVDLLVAFVGGASPDLVLHGLEGSSSLRDAMELEMEKISGVTVTPYPTSYQFAIPVTGSDQDLTVATETPITIVVTAIVTNDQGANLRSEPNADSALVIALPDSTPVEVLGASEDRLWVFVRSLDGANGWLYVPLISLDSPIEILPILE